MVTRLKGSESANDLNARAQTRERISVEIRMTYRARWARQLPPPRSSEAAAAAALRTHDDVCSALPAAGYTDRVFQALDPVCGTSQGSLDRGLANVRRKNLSCCRRTIHIESRPVQSCLNCHSLLALDHLLLCLASRRQHGQN